MIAQQVTIVWWLCLVGSKEANKSCDRRNWVLQTLICDISNTRSSNQAIMCWACYWM
jgi:hypothetical protein